MTLSDDIHGRLIVSCQADDESPFHDPVHMLPMARAAVLGGASALRVEGVDHVRATSDLGVPIVGLIKRSERESPVYITSTCSDVEALARAGARVVAMDATARPRARGERLADLVRTAHELGCEVLGDVESIESARYAEEAGVDWIGTTLSGYVPPRELSEPDIDLVRQISHTCLTPVIAEGRYTRPEQLAAAFADGAWSVVVGRAISDPLRTTRRFSSACPVGPTRREETTA